MPTRSSTSPLEPTTTWAVTNAIERPTRSAATSARRTSHARGWVDGPARGAWRASRVATSVVLLTSDPVLGQELPYATTRVRGKEGQVHVGGRFSLPSGHVLLEAPVREGRYLSGRTIRGGSGKSLPYGARVPPPAGITCLGVCPFPQNHPERSNSSQPREGCDHAGRSAADTLRAPSTTLLGLPRSLIRAPVTPSRLPETITSRTPRYGNHGLTASPSTTPSPDPRVASFPRMVSRRDP